MTHVREESKIRVKDMLDDEGRREVMELMKEIRELREKRRKEKGKG